MSKADSTDFDAQIAAFDPTNPEALAALEKQLMGDDTTTDTTDGETSLVDGSQAAADETKPGVDAAKQDEKPASEPEASAAAATQTEEGAPSGVQKPKGVQAKDGDHIIPYSVLERERDRAARAESTAKALSDQLEALQAGKQPVAAATQGKLTEEDLAQMDVDLPGVAKVIRAQIAAIDSLTGTIQSLQQENEIAQNNRQAAAQDQTEAAIQGNPDILAWREQASRKDNPDPLMWNRAADLDAVLRSDPAWQDKPIAERFAKVAESIRSIYGAPPAPVVDPIPPKKEPQADLKQVADAKLQAAPAAVPTTLSDIPGGAPPAQNDLESLDNASSVAIGQKFLSMSTDQLDAYLARIGI